MPAITSNFSVPDFADREELSTGQGYVIVATPATPGVGINFDDGDVIGAVTWKNLRHTRAQELCQARPPRVNASGYVPDSDCLKTYMDRCYQYRYEFLSSTVARRILLADLTFEDVPDRLNDRIADWQLPGPRGGWLLQYEGTNTIFYYGGRRVNPSNTDLDDIWSAIETQLGVQEQDEVKFTATDLRNVLVIETDDFTDARVSVLHGQRSDGVAPVRQTIDWRQLPGVVEADVTDPQKAVDLTGQRRGFIGLIASNKP